MLETSNPFFVISLLTISISHEDINKAMDLYMKGELSLLAEDISSAQENPDAVIDEQSSFITRLNVHTNNNESCRADLQATMNSKWDYDSKNVRNVFLRDIATISNKNSTKAILAMRNIHGCIDNNSQELHEFVKKILDGYDIDFVDLGYELYQLSNSYPKRFPNDKLKGFKSSLGYGHLNEKGHEAYSEILKVKLKKFLML